MQGAEAVGPGRRDPGAEKHPRCQLGCLCRDTYTHTCPRAERITFFGVREEWKQMDPHTSLPTLLLDSFLATAVP